MGRLRLLFWTGLVAFLSAVQYAGRVSGGKPDRNVLYRYSTAVGSAAAYAVILGLVLVLAGFRRDLLGLRRPRSWWRAIVLSLVLLIGVYLSIALIDPLLHGGQEQGLTPTGWQPSHAGAYIANAVVVAGVAPVVEELTYRGLGFALLERFGVPFAIVGTALAFALSHGLVQAFPELFLFGCALAWLRSRTGSVYPGMVLHGLFNGLSLLAAVAT